MVNRALRKVVHIVNSFQGSVIVISIVVLKTTKGVLIEANFLPNSGVVSGKHFLAVPVDDCEEAGHVRIEDDERITTLGLPRKEENSLVDVSNRLGGHLLSSSDRDVLVIRIQRLI